MGHHNVTQFLLSMGAEIQGRFGPRMEPATRVKREAELKSRHEQQLKQSGQWIEPPGAVVNLKKK